jgi:HAD superfamily hydrolase (TIGR01458 family)
MTALMIDLDGVLYEGERPIPGAADAIGWLRDREIPHLFVTNTTSRSRRTVVDKLAGIGIDVDEDDVLTPPVAAARRLAGRVDGPVALFVQPDTVADFAGLRIAGAGEQRVAAVVVGDYGARWDFAELNRAFRLLMQDPQPLLVALGMTRYWQAEDGLRLDTAPFVVALAHASGVEPVVLGKPARPFFESALDKLGAAPGEAVMIGDDIRGDVGGAQQAGIAGVLVRTGKFRPGDLDGDVSPDLVLDSIAALPGCWEKVRDLV